MSRRYRFVALHRHISIVSCSVHQYGRKWFELCAHGRASSARPTDSSAATFARYQADHRTPCLRPLQPTDMVCQPPPNQDPPVILPPNGTALLYSLDSANRHLPNVVAPHHRVPRCSCQRRSSCRASVFTACMPTTNRVTPASIPRQAANYNKQHRADSCLCTEHLKHFKLLNGSVAGSNFPAHSQPGFPQLVRR